jgi:hypothetical protein
VRAGEIVTPAQLAAVKIGDNVTLRESRGRVTQTTRTWFMVMWQDGTPEIVRRQSSILVNRLHLDTPKGAKQ